jgi:hypothetical protein
MQIALPCQGTDGGGAQFVLPLLATDGGGKAGVLGHGLAVAWCAVE